MSSYKDIENIVKRTSRDLISFFSPNGRHTDQNNGSLRVYFVVQILPFIDWTCGGGEECGATAEITRSLQIDLVLSDAAANSEP